MDKVSYALGLSIGQNFKASGFENINGEDFLLGLNSVLNDTEPVMTIEEAKETINIRKRKDKKRKQEIKK